MRTADKYSPYIHRTPESARATVTRPVAVRWRTPILRPGGPLACHTVCKKSGYHIIRLIEYHNEHKAGCVVTDFHISILHGKQIANEIGRGEKRMSIASDNDRLQANRQTARNVPRTLSRG